MKKIIAVALFVFVCGSSVYARSNWGVSLGFGPGYGWGGYPYGGWWGGPNVGVGFGPNYDGYYDSPVYQADYRDNYGRRHWRMFNQTNRPLTVQALSGGEIERFSPGSTHRVSRGSSFNFRVSGPGLRPVTFSSSAHRIYLYLNRYGQLSARSE